jgi:hypothetical protein
MEACVCYSELGDVDNPALHTNSAVIVHVAPQWRPRRVAPPGSNMRGRLRLVAPPASLQVLEVENDSAVGAPAGTAAQRRTQFTAGASPAAQRRTQLAAGAFCAKQRSVKRSSQPLPPEPSSAASYAVHSRCPVPQRSVERSSQPVPLEQSSAATNAVHSLCLPTKQRRRRTQFTALVGQGDKFPTCARSPGAGATSTAQSSNAVRG